jgi:flagellin-like hook-associated protein FlgL
MFHSDELKDELQALKGEASRLLNTTGEGIFDASKTHADALADQIKAALNDLGFMLRRH